MKNFLSLIAVFLFLISAAQAKDLRFAQISDVRFSSSAKNSELKQAIVDINKQKNVEFVVFTGDNISRPAREELVAFLKEAKKLNCPFYVIIGDKDVNKNKHLGKKDYVEILKKNIRKYKQESPNYIFENNGFVFVAVDGAKDVIPGTSGYYKDDVLSWLDTELTNYSDKNVIIFQHFPIIPPSDKETYYTFKPENYMAVLAKHENVRAVISGHFGVNSEKTYDGILHITTAGLPYYRIIDILDCDTQPPVIWAQLKRTERH